MNLINSVSFSGNVRIYDEEVEDHVIPWRNGGGQPHEDVVHLQLSLGAWLDYSVKAGFRADEWKRITDKLNQYRGLIRIQGPNTNSPLRKLRRRLARYRAKKN